MHLQHAKLIKAMIHYESGNPARIQHFLKVHELAALIGTLEGLDEHTQFILETTAILHDIGIPVSIAKYGSYTWKTQESEGPAEAEKLMIESGNFSQEVIQRVKYLIAHHHTYNNISGMDYQILLEADILVNLSESVSKNYKALAHVFRTQTGKSFLQDMYHGNL